MPRRRALDGDGSDASKRLKIIDPMVEANCALVAEAVSSSGHLSEACRNMLVAGARMSLGVPRAERDEFQGAVAGFIGEVLQQVEAELKAAVANRDEEVRVAKSVGEPIIRQAEERISEAQDELKAAREMLKACELDLENAIVMEQDAAKRWSDAEAARNQGEAELLAAQLECDICENGCALLLRGEGHLDAVELQRVAAKLKLEESLVLMLPCMTKKTLSERTTLEQMASNLLSEAIGRHATELRKHCESQGAAAISRAAEAESAKKIHAESQVCKQHRVDALEKAREKTFNAESGLKAAGTARDNCALELAGLEQIGKEARRELHQYREGPLVAFEALLSNSDVGA